MASSSEPRQAYLPSSSSSSPPGSSTVRPKDAAISCAHFWAGVLIVTGVVEAIIGAILFSEWEGVGSMWVGVVAIAAGIAGCCVTGSRPSGGTATAFYLALTAFTLGAALVSGVLGDGITYIAVNKTEGNCFDTSSCAEESLCAERDCVCWEPDGSNTCESGSTVRYCLRYAGDSCDDIGDFESLLFASSIALLIISVVSLCSFMVAAATYWRCKRIIIREPLSDPPRR